jgi:hypothetical protein
MWVRLKYRGSKDPNNKLSALGFKLTLSAAGEFIYFWASDYLGHGRPGPLSREAGDYPGFCFIYYLIENRKSTRSPSASVFSPEGENYRKKHDIPN